MQGIPANIQEKASTLQFSHLTQVPHEMFLGRGPCMCKVHVLTEGRDGWIDRWMKNKQWDSLYAVFSRQLASILWPRPPLSPMSLSSSDAPCQKHWGAVTSGRQGLEGKSRGFLAGKIASLRSWEGQYQQGWAGLGWGWWAKVSRVCWALCTEAAGQGNARPALELLRWRARPSRYHKELRFRRGCEFLRITN